MLYTDGITETIDENEEEFGLPRLEKLVKKRRGLDPDALVDLIFDEVGAFSNGAEAADDRTVMVVQRRRGEADA